MGKPRLYYNASGEGIHFPKLHTICKCVECKDNYVEDGEIWPYKEEFDGLNHGEGQHGKPENGVYLIKWSTGHKRYEWEYKNGKRADGVAMGWYPDGKPKQLSTWKNGELNGLRRYWWASGHIQRDENLISGELNGQPKIKGYYDTDGKPNGLWVWYTNRGDKLFEGYFKDGKKDGTWKSWIPEYDEIGLK